MSDTSVLVSLAVLKVNWDSNKKDYIHNFIPFIVECLKDTSSEVVSVPELKKQVEERFGLSFPHNVIIRLLARANKGKYVRKEYNAYYINREMVESSDINAVQQRVLTAHDAVITSFQQFCLNEHKADWSYEESESALIKYFDEEILQMLHVTHNRALIKISGSSPSNYKFIVASFIRKLQELNDPRMEYLEEVFKGNMLANALFVKDQGKVMQKFKKTTVYFDTAFLLFVLGYTGDSRREPSQELLNLLYETGADLKCFRHTVSEVKAILEGCAADLGGSGRNHYDLTGFSLESFEHFILRGKTDSDVRLLAEKIESSLELLRIKVIDTPSYDDHSSVNDEKGLEDSIRSKITYRNNNSLTRDVKSISSIYRLRGNKSYYSIEDCRALFVTTNHRLVKVANEHFNNDYKEEATPPLITDTDLTNLLWLKKPTKAPNLARKMIIANSYAALQPDEILWKKYMQELEKLKGDKSITNEDYFILRHSLDAKQALVQVTEGDSGAFAQGTVSEILEMVKENTQKKLKERIGELEGEKESSYQRVVAAEEKEQIRITNIKNKSNKYARLVSKGIEFIFIVFLTSVVVYTFPWEIPVLWNKYLLSGLFILLLSVMIINMMYGTTIKSLIRKLELVISRQIEKVLINLSS
ncbi:hypothetical protein [Paenibacillus agaridevorans]|uniref:hypothetical protein n=1 Tax=Paenibacillus agaridevorans TaxID=171404 RepID=UPI001BE421A5|nr:hypothetical protein [Paenibacillus agaridevorans]